MRKAATRGPSQASLLVTESPNFSHAHNAVQTHPGADKSINEWKHGSTKYSINWMVFVTKEVVELDQVSIRFAGDSGDGMQLTGDQFTSTTAIFGNDLTTLPDFPAEIRAPQGTLPGVSAFQLHFGDHDIMTPGDQAHAAADLL